MSDDTTTQFSEELNEDKILILNGLERLKYFSNTSPDYSSPLSQRKNGLMDYFSKLLN
jgi:hypothetical protein